MKLHFTASHSEPAQKSFAALTKKYGQADAKNAEIFVALGGDGQVLRTLYEAMQYDKPVFAVRRTGGRVLQQRREKYGEQRGTEKQRDQGFDLGEIIRAGQEFGEDQVHGRSLSYARQVREGTRRQMQN